MYHAKGGTGVQVTKGKPKPDARNGTITSRRRGGRHRRMARSSTTRSGRRLFNPYNNLDFPLSQVVRRDRVTGVEDTITEAAGQRLPPGPLARRDQARLRHPPGQRDRAADPRPGHRRGGAG